MDLIQTSVGYEQKALLEQLNNEFTETVLPVTVFIGIEAVLGFVGNVLVIFIFLFRYRVCNFKYFVLCLAFIDITSTLTTMSGEIVSHLYWYNYPNDILCKVKSFFNMFTVVAEALCLLTIATDRFRKICKPFGRQMKPNNAKIACLLIYITAFIFASPVPFLWGLSFHQKIYKGYNVTITVCETDRNFQDTSIPLQYSVTMETVISICLISMFVLYMFVARTLMRNKINGHVPGGVKQKSSSLVDDSSSNVAESKPGHSDTGYSSNSEQGRQIQSRERCEKPSGNTKASQSEQTNETCETDMSATGKGTLSLSAFSVKNISEIGSTDEGLTTDEDRGLTTDEDDSGNQENLKIKTSKQIRSRSKSRKSKTKYYQTKRTRRKTLIMIVLTVIFMITTVLYLTLLSFIAMPDGILDNMSHIERALYFLFFRFYFINHVINPVVYGLLDPHFRQVLLKKRSV